MAKGAEAKAELFNKLSDLQETFARKKTQGS